MTCKTSVNENYRRAYLLVRLIIARALSKECFNWRNEPDVESGDCVVYASVRSR